MKLFILGLAACGYAQTPSIASIEDGATWGETECVGATSWSFAHLGDVTTTEALTVSSADGESTDGYLLQGNTITITKDSKKRSMMGTISCGKGSETLATLMVTGKPVFKNLPNALTNLDQDENKRIECQVEGYPVPVVSWQFQAIEKEQYAIQCPDKSCSLCTENCEDSNFCCSESEPNASESCIADNSTDIFNVINNEAMKDTTLVRYSKVDTEGCPMDGTDVTGSENCKVASTKADVDTFSVDFQSKTQLFFKKIQYSHGGKYICVARQTIGEDKYTRTKPFIWRVKDPMAALWPFLALVSEVIIVVCIILYYERASQKGDKSEDVEEGDEFITTKKEDS